MSVIWEEESLVGLHSLLGVLCIHFRNRDQKVGSPSLRQLPRGDACMAECCLMGRADPSQPHVHLQFKEDDTGRSGRPQEDMRL